VDIFLRKLTKQTNNATAAALRSDAMAGRLVGFFVQHAS